MDVCFLQALIWGDDWGLLGQPLFLFFDAGGK